MPQYAGLLLENGKFCGPLYRVTMQLAPDKFGISRDATNEEMLTGFLECINKQTKAAIAAARAEGEAAGYRRAIDEACAALGKRAGYLRNFDLAVEIVRAHAPVEPVSPADGLPAKGGV